MTWTRIATAAILIPVVVALVLFTPTSVVAIATAIITILALREYFALGDAIGHRAYRLWTIFCALLFVFMSQTALVTSSPALVHRLSTLFSPVSIFFLFVLGITALTLW